MTAKPAPSDSFQLLREYWLRLVVAAGLGAVLFGNSGFRSLFGNWRELRRLQGDIANLARDERDLNERLKSLRAGDGGVERSARLDLGYIKKGEIEYRFPPPAKKE
jgi:cell division protein FtsB